jgi:hypothetical protein
MALKTNLVSYWKMDEASGNRADSHGSFTLTDNNTVLAGTGIINNGADFESSASEYFSWTADAAFLPAAMSISCWIKKESNTGLNAIFSKEASGVGYVLYTNGSTLSMTFQGIDTLSHGTSISTATWYHVVFTWDGTNGKIYLNNGSPATTATFTSLNSSTAAQAIGNRSAGVSTGYFDGIIDEVAFWSRAISAAEVAEIYNGGAGLAYTSWDLSTFVPKIMMC